MKLTIRNLTSTLVFFVFIGCLFSSFLNNPVKSDQKKTPAVTATVTVTDKDGNVYKTVTIGTQIWMAENLRTTKFRNGDPIPNISANTSWTALTTGAYCWYNNDAANKAGYGALYNWYAVNDSRNISPIGWHIPSDEEWKALTIFLQGKSLAGGKLKETGIVRWADPNSGATNSSGFTALPGGLRAKDGVFKNLSLCGTWWANTEYTKSVGWYRYVDYGTSNIYGVSTYKTSGFSVRCVKD